MSAFDCPVMFVAKELSGFWGNRQSGGDKGLNVQEENMLLPALATMRLHL